MRKKLHHFRSHVDNGTTEMSPIDTKNQLADHLTEPLNLEDLVRLRKQVMGWQHHGQHRQLVVVVLVTDSVEVV